MNTSTGSIEFANVRAFRDSEIRDALQRILKDPQALLGLGKYWLGDLALIPPMRWAFGKYLRFLARRVTSIRGIHNALARPVRRLTDKYMDGLEVRGLDPLAADPQPRLYISNHRDIALDSMVLNLKLYEAGLGPARVAIGDNLIQLPPWGFLIMRIVGCFMVDRTSGSRREQYQNHRELSAYIRHLLTEEGLSVWLAQRSGRSLDGQDLTDPTVLKMLHLCDRKRPFGEHLAAVSTVPVTLSYEYDPCDLLKARRLAAAERNQSWEPDYAREAQQGLLGDKGRVCLHFGEALDGERFDTAEQMAAELDDRIHRGYRLWPTAFAAAERIECRLKLDCPWSAEELRRAHDTLQARCRDLDDLERRHFMNYYANAAISLDRRLQS